MTKPTCECWREFKTIDGETWQISCKGDMLYWRPNGVHREIVFIVCPYCGKPAEPIDEKGGDAD